MNKLIFAKWISTKLKVAYLEIAFSSKDFLNFGVSQVPVSYKPVSYKQKKTITMNQILAIQIFARKSINSNYIVVI